MKILQLIPYFVPAWNYGGPIPVAYNISKELVRRGHKVTVYTTDTLNADSRIEEKEEVIDGVRVKRFSNLSNFLASKHHLFFPPSLVKALRDTLSEFQVIHVHEYWVLSNAVLLHYARKYGIPYLVQAHGSLPIMLSKQNVKRIYNLLVGYSLLRSASRVIALTPAEAEQYKDMGVSKDKIEIIPNGIDLSEYTILPPRGGFRQKYGLGAEEKLALYLGRVHQSKGIDLLVEALATSELDKIKLAIVGPDDGYLSILQKLIIQAGISNRVLFTGPLYGEDKYKAYVDADVYVLPSISEGFPVSVLESCACRTPVVITDTCSIADIIDGQAGIVIPRNRGQLVKALEAILSNHKMGQELGEKGRSLILKRFNWQVIAEQVERVYLGCVRTPN
jgi:glycosyltransferase involved in cell wall biosynthesis